MNTRIVRPFLLLFFLFFLTPIYFSYSQGIIEKDTLKAWEYYKAADSLFKKRAFKDAIISLEKTIPIYEKANAWLQIARSYNTIARNYKELSDFESSLKNTQKALSISNTKVSTLNEEQANAYYNLGDYYVGISSFKDAVYYYEKSIEIVKEVFSDTHPKVVFVLNQLGDIYLEQSNFDKAIANIENAIAIGDANYELHRKNLGKSYELYGKIHHTNRNLKASVLALDRALEIQLKEYGENHLNTASVYNNIGIAYYLDQELDKSLMNYLKSIKIRKAILEKDHLEILKTTEYIALIFYIKGEYKKALEYFERILETKLKKYDADNIKLAHTYNYLHFSHYALKNYQKALDFNKKSVEIFKAFYSENHFTVIRGYLLFSEIYTRFNQYDKALFYAQEAARINYKLYKDNNTGVFGIYAALGNSYLNLKDYNNALKSYQIDLDNKIRYYGKKHIYTSISLHGIGRLFTEKEEPQKAIDYFKKSIIALGIDINKENQPLKLYKGGGHGDLYLKNLSSLGASYLKLYSKNREINDLHKSINIYKKADRHIDTLKQLFSRYEDRLEFTEISREVNLALVNRYYTLFTETREKDVLKKLFYHSEKDHSNILEEHLIASNTKIFSGLPQNIIDLEALLKDERSNYTSQIYNELDKKQIDSSALSFHQDKLFLINRRYDSLTEVLESSYPKYYNLRYNTSVISVEEVQAKLDDKTTLLEFFTADSTTYAFTISKTAFDVLELSTPDLLELVEKQRKALGEKNSALYKKLGRELYNLLVSPLKDKLVGDNLIIVPDGPLWHLNFDLLLTEDINSNNPVDYPYLLKQYAISYANSANLLFNRPDIKKKDVRNEALAFSYSDTTDLVNGEVLRLGAFRDIGEDLPGTRKEIKAISGIVKGAYYYGKEAVEANFKKQAGNYSIVHLALHGEVDNENPQNSRLFFTKSKDSLEDNLLYSHELFALNIPAELTVLSACNTGTGKIAKGEGIMSLGNAFQYAGTKSLLLSSWEVADDTAPELMKYFYQNLKKGMSKAKALQQAKIEFLNTADPARTHPFYWGNFYLVGDAKPVKLNSNKSIYWVVIGITILGLGLLLYNRKKKQQTKQAA